MRIEREHDGEFGRWSLEVDDWLVRFVVLAVVMVLVPGAGVAIAQVARAIAG